MPRETPSQTAGPYLHIGMAPTQAGLAGVFEAHIGTRRVPGDAAGTRITLSGHVFDGTGTSLRDALVEAWQADADGRFDTDPDPDPTGWGRAVCDGETGLYTFDTVKPGRVAWPDGRLQAPHVTLWIVARGINLGLHTRAYFADEAAANAEDPILSAIAQQGRRATLLARSDGPGRYTFDIHLQGPDETIFFDI